MKSDATIAGEHELMTLAIEKWVERLRESRPLDDWEHARMIKELEAAKEGRRWV